MSSIIGSTSSIPVYQSCSVLDSVMYRLSHKFVVKNFSWFYGDVAEEDESKSDHPSVYSGQFSSPENPDLAFQLCLRPKGDDEESKDFVSIYLEKVRPFKSKIAAKFTISVLDSNGGKAISFSVGKLYRVSH